MTSARPRDFGFRASWDAALRRLASGATPRVVAAELGVPADVVYTWTRSGDPVSIVVYLQRKPSDGDLLEFTANYAIKVDGYWEVAHPDWPPEPARHGVVHDRISAFVPNGDGDTWWSVQCGLLAGECMTRRGLVVTDDPAAIEQQIVRGIQGMVAFLDAIDTIDAVIAIHDEDPSHLRVRQTEVGVLRQLRGGR